MQADPGETRNLFEDRGYASLVQEHRAEIQAFFDRYADPEYDLWHGGRSKAGRLIQH